MITNKLVMYGCVVPAVMEKLCIVWTCYMLVEFLNTSTDGQNPPIQQNRRNFGTSCAIWMPFGI